MREVVARYRAISAELREADRFVAAEPLKTTDTATTVRIRDGETLVTDGPFAEIKEHLGGFYLIDVPDLDAALRVAARFPAAAAGCVEVRPVLEHFFPDIG